MQKTVVTGTMKYIVIHPRRN